MTVEVPIALLAAALTLMPGVPASIAVAMVLDARGWHRTARAIVIAPVVAIAYLLMLAS